MILPHVIFLFTLLMPAFSDPDLPHALAKLSEAKARVLATRAKLKANSARITNHIRSSRTKRQYPEYVHPPPPPPHYEEPTLIHICPIENDYYDRSAEEHDQGTRMRTTEGGDENPLNRALEQLTEVKQILHKFEEDNLQSRTSDSGERGAEADAHFNRFHSHSHVHSTVHSHGFPQTQVLTPGFPQTQVLTPGFQIPHTQVTTPGLNLNINQNQGLSGLSHGLPATSFINQGGLSPSQSTFISSQSQPIFTSRTNAPVIVKDAEADAEAHRPHHPHNPHHGVKPHFTHGYNGRPVHHGGHGEPFHHGRPRADEEDVETSAVLKEANPTLKKLKKLKMKKEYQSYPQYQAYPQYQPYPQYRPYAQYRPNSQYQPYPVHYGVYREAEKESSVSQADDDDNDGHSLRDADPTLHKLKKLKMKKEPYPQYQAYPQYQTYPQYQPHPVHYGVYREVEEERGVPRAEDDDSDGDFSRDADPTLHKLKKLKMKKQYQPYPSQYGFYRDTEEEAESRKTEDEAENRNVEEEAESRDASPTINKLKEKFKTKYHQTYPVYAHGYRESEDENLVSSNFLFNVPDRRFSDQFKRSIDKQLDEILTKERQLVDSLSTEAKKDEDLKLITDIGNRTLTSLEKARKKITKRSIPLTRLLHDPNVKLDVPQTLENFGTVTKNAIEDDRAPMHHVKHMVGSSKNAFLSAMKIPPQNLIIPSDYEIVKTAERDAANPDTNDPFVHTFTRMGEIVRDSIKSGQETAVHLGEAAHSARKALYTARHSTPHLIIPYSQVPVVQDTRRRRPHKAVLVTPRLVDLTDETSPRDSRPNFVRLGHLMDAVGISKPDSKSIGLEKITLEPENHKRLSHLVGKFRSNYDDANTVGEAINNLEDAKISVGARNLRDFLVKMRSQLTETAPKPTSKKQQEIGKFIETLFDRSIEEPKNDNTVGASLFLPPELMHPFMGRPSETEVKKFLRDNGDNLPNDLPKTGDNNADLGHVLGAINPLMFERLYKQTIPDKKDNDTVGTFQMVGPMMKPFIGHQMELFNEYNQDEEEDYSDIKD